MTNRIYPDLVAHADWSTHPNKRWVSIALRDGRFFRIESPELVGDLTNFIERLKDRAGGRQIVVGFDFPIGLPAAYAHSARVTDFLDFLIKLEKKEWEDFFKISEKPNEISFHRPFYPKSPGGTSQSHLINGLGVQSIGDLLRKCERANSGRGPAAVLFWLIGAKQVGRAAISGWQEVIIPAIRSKDISASIWPFHGTLNDLLKSRSCILVETYPAEACFQLGFQPPGRTWSKRNQDDRRNFGPKLINWAAEREVSLVDSIKSAIEDGFGPLGNGEDKFDSVLGIMSMLEVVLGHRLDGAPEDQSVRRIEGWIFGQNPITEDNKNPSRIIC